MSGELRRYEGRVSLITGAASGIGRATARRLSDEGARVHLVDVDEAGLASVVEALIDDGHRATGSAADVSDPDRVRQVVRECIAAHGRLDHVANNAGVYLSSPLDRMPIEDWDRSMAINLEGTFYVAQAAAEEMTGRLGSAITNIASVYGEIGDSFDPMAGYAASKAAVASITRQLAVEYAARGIRVNAICPGMVETPMNDTWKADRASWSSFISSRIPCGRAATAEELAAVHAFLGSDEASYVTAATIYVDGGWSAS